ncbi:fimbria/pilus outer membrane usher protein [Aeromonas salmonicida]
MKYYFLSLLSLLVIVFPVKGLANYEFDPVLLGGNVDIDTLSGLQPPGVYLVEVLLNGHLVDTREFTFEREPDGTLQTCLDKTQLLQYGVKVDDYPALFGQVGGGATDRTASELCTNISAIPHASASFDLYSQQLRLSLPQVALVENVRGSAPQALWDDGITAFLMNYRVSVNRSSSRADYGSYLNEQWSAILEPGLNLGPWRVRNSSSWQPGQWQYAYTFAERGLNQLQSRITLGERFSSLAVLDGVPLTGVMLATDESMAPYEHRVYGPVVRGTARSQARVEVKQNGYIIFSTTVAPGPFEFNDLASGGVSGDLEVTVFESDGAPQIFTVTYATPAIALREGVFKYELAGGHYRSARKGVEKAPLGQLSLMYGMPFGLTTFGGAQWSSHYSASTLGIGASLGMLGALSIDASHGRWQQQGLDSESGKKWRLLYSKYVEHTQSWFSLESNQYAANGFRSMTDVLDSYVGSEWTSATNLQNSGLAKMSTSVTLGQSLGGWGNLKIATIHTSYRNDRQSDESLRLSYGNTYKGVSLSLDWSNSYRGELGWQPTKRDREFGVRFSYPLSFGQSQPAYISYQLRDSNSHAQQHEIGLQGEAFDRRMRWDVREQRTVGREQGANDRSLLNLGWSGQYGVLNGGYGYGRNSRQINANLAGGIVLHEDGVTLGQPLGQTVGLVIAPDAGDMVIGSWPGVRTDPRGYTTLGSLSPYQLNEVAVDPLTMPEDVSLSQTEIKVVPTRGAVVPVKFATRKGVNGMIKLSLPDGSLIPFGAVVAEEGETRTGMSVGVVGYEGDVYLTGLQDTGRLLVRWGADDDHQCLVDYNLPASPSEFGGVYELREICE